MIAKGPIRGERRRIVEYVRTALAQALDGLLRQCEHSRTASTHEFGHSAIPKNATGEA